MVKHIIFKKSKDIFKHLHRRKKRTGEKTNLRNLRNRILILTGRGGKGHFVSSSAYGWNRKGRW